MSKSRQIYAFCLCGSAIFLLSCHSLYSPLFFVFLCLLCGYGFFVATSKMVIPGMFLSVGVHFMILLIGYYNPDFASFEDLLLPLVLIGVEYYYQPIIAIVILILLGPVGGVVESHRYYNLLDGDFSVFWSHAKFSCMFYTSCSALCISSIVNKLSTQKLRHERDEAILLVNHLGKMSKDISQQLFSIQKASSQKERERITKEIHDTAGYVFINIIMILQAAQAVLEKDNDKGKASSLIENALDYARRGINEIRYDLRQIRLENQQSLSLANDLHDIGATFTSATQVAVHLELGNCPVTLGEEYDAFLKSFLQEGLTNALKHGYATSVTLYIWLSQMQVTATISDNGRGCHDVIVPGIGLKGIKDFVEEHGGGLFFPQTVEGFSISVSLYYANEENNAL